MKLTPVQARFLRFFLSGPPDRAFWLRDGRRLAPVSDPFTLHPEATHALVYRLAGGEGMTLPGEAIERTRITVADLRALEGCWDQPLRTLSPIGADLARKRLPKRAYVAAFRQTAAEREALHAAARRAGLAPAVVVAELVAAFLEDQAQLGPKTAVAGNGKG